MGRLVLCLCRHSGLASGNRPMPDRFRACLPVSSDLLNVALWLKSPKHLPAVLIFYAQRASQCARGPSVAGSQMLLGLLLLNVVSHLPLARLVHLSQEAMKVVSCTVPVRKDLRVAFGA